MYLNELLSSFKELANENNISTPYIVGGLPRDKIMGFSIKDVKDIDITTGDKGSFALGLIASKKWPNANFRTYDDGHSSLDFDNIRIDFSNHFVIPGIEKELEKLNINNPTEMEKEIYSRDFTINTLLQPMDLAQKPLDITKLGIGDIENKILRTLINPELTIGFDPRRILRAIKLIVKFNLNIEKDLEDTIVEYRGNISKISFNHIKKQINQMLKLDSGKTIKLLSKYKLLPIIPLSKLMQLEISKNHMVQYLLEGSEV